MTLHFLILILIFVIPHGDASQTPSELPGEFLGATGKHLFHFVHVTDIHITHSGDADRTEQFEQFCNETIKSIVKPQVTVVSGDLVHNLHLKSLSQPCQEDWKTYKNILLRTNVTQYTTWLDMRGNHDVFMDSDPESKKSFYRIYSYQGVNQTGSYQYTLKTKDNDIYSFVSIDMTPRPGTSLPLNFMGKINKVEMQKILALSKQTENSNTTIFVGHYPLSFTYSKGIQDVMRRGIVYLNGHLHCYIKHLYTRHSNGLLELELGDWKNNRRFRIITIDGGILSFNDFRFEQSIYAVISNPKAAKFKTSREPLYRLSYSTHIRIVVFNKWPIVDIRVSIDSTFLGRALPSRDNPKLFILRWNASKYNDGNLHWISVEIKDDHGNVEKLEHEFSLSTSTITAWNLSKLILFFHWPTFSILGYTLLIVTYILVLLYFRYRARRMVSCCTRCFSLWNSFRLRMMLLCSVDLLYYSLLGLGLYHCVGPWYIGHLTDGHFGAAFLWGTIMRGMYQPPDMQPVMGMIQFLFFLFPFTFSLCSSCFYRYTQLQLDARIHESPSHRCVRICTVYLIFGYTLAFILVWSFATTSSFKFGWILSPFGLTLSIFASFLYIASCRLKMNHFRLLSTKSHEKTHANNEFNLDNRKLLDTNEVRETIVTDAKEYQ